MVLRYSEQNFTSRLEYRPRCINIADPLIGNPLGGNAFVDVLSHDSLGCRDFRLRALLAMSCSMLSSREMATNISMVLSECRQMRYVVVLSASMNNWLIKSNRFLNPSLQDMLTIHGYLIFYFFWVDQAPKKNDLISSIKLIIFVNNTFPSLNFLHVLEKLIETCS